MRKDAGLRGWIKAGRPLALAAVVLTALTFSGTASGAGTPKPRVVGGQATTIGAWPWQVAILSAGSGSAYNRQFCGGSLVAPTIVITAAHCVYENGSFTPAGQLSVATGRTNLSASATGQEIPVAQVHVLRGAGGQVLYNPNASSYDVEILELAQPSTAGTIKLAGAGEAGLWAGGRTAFVTGWGSTVPSGGGYPDGLRVAQVRMFSDSECGNALGSLFKATTMVCAGAPPSRDTCDGDSGGPLVVPMTGGGYRLVGDTSFGLNEDCGLSPSAYGRLAADPLRTLIRNKVLQVAGVDVVGTGGGGGTTLTATQALDASWTYSEKACRTDRRCRRYWAGDCVARGSGFGCQVRNYERLRHRRKATCIRNLSITGTASAPVTTPIGSWTCRRGWHRSTAQRSIRPGIRNG